MTAGHLSSKARIARKSTATTQRARRPTKTGVSKAPPWGNALPGAAERAEIKRGSILREAAHCFNRSGFHGTSMDDIARELHVTKASLYRYVQSKHDVLFAIFNLGLDSGFKHLESAENSGASGLEKLRMALRGYLEDMIGSLGHSVVLLEENALRPEQSRIIIQRRDEAEKRFRALVSEGIADGSIMPCEPKLAIFAFLGAVSWVPKWYRDDGEWSAALVAQSLVDLLLQGIAAPTPKAPKTAVRRRGNTPKAFS